MSKLQLAASPPLCAEGFSFPGKAQPFPEGRRPSEHAIAGEFAVEDGVP